MHVIAKYGQISITEEGICISDFSFKGCDNHGGETMQLSVLRWARERIEQEIHSEQLLLARGRDIEIPEGMIDAQQFEELFGRAPEQDDLDRVNCGEAGTLGHVSCGICGVHNLPRFMCGCAARLED